MKRLYGKLIKEKLEEGIRDKKNDDQVRFTVVEMPFRNISSAFLMECIGEVVTAQDEKDLAHMIKKIVEIYSRNGLTINFDKTEYIPI